MKDLLATGVERDAITVYPREINGMSGAIGSYTKSDVTYYIGRFYVSQDTIGSIFAVSVGDDTLIKSVLKTLNVTKSTL